MQKNLPLRNAADAGLAGLFNSLLMVSYVETSIESSMDSQKPKVYDFAYL